MAKEIDLEKCHFRQFLELQNHGDLELTLDWVNIISACTTHVELPVCLTVWLYPEAIWKYGHLKFVKSGHSTKFELS